MDLSLLGGGSVPVGSLMKYASYLDDIIVNEAGTFVRSGTFVLDDGWDESLNVYAPYNGWSASLAETNITNLHASSVGTWIVAGNRTSVIRSTDNGETFSTVSVPAFTDVKGMTTDDAGTWLAVDSTSGGTSFSPFVSTDNGLTWSSSSSGSGTPTGAIDTNKNGVWVYALGNQLKRATSDLGNSAAATNVLTSSGNCKVIKHGSAAVWLAGSTTNRTVYRSSDNGLTWSQVATVGASSDIFDIGYDGDQKWAVLASARLILSTDNGLTWSSDITLPGTITSGRVIHLGGTEWLIVHNNGTWHTDDDFATFSVKQFTGTGFLDAHLNGGKLLSVKGAGVGIGEHASAVGLPASGLTAFDYMRIL